MKYLTTFTVLLLVLNATLAQNKVAILSNGFIVGDDVLPPLATNNNLFYYDRDQYATRMGILPASYVDPDSVGLYSFAGGGANLGLGEYTFTYGFNNFNRGDRSFAFGSQNSVNTSSSVAMGSNNILDDFATSSLALGTQNRVLSPWSIALGLRNTVDGSSSAAIGNDNLVFEFGSFALGSNHQVSGNNSFAVGANNIIDESASYAFGNDNNLAGTQSLVLGSSNIVNFGGGIAIGSGNSIDAGSSIGIGQNLESISAFSFNIGRYNNSIGSNLLSDTNRSIFTIGNGTSDTNRSNAMVVLANGKTMIGTDSPSDKLEVHAIAGEDAFHVVTGTQTALRIFENGSISVGSNNVNVAEDVLYVNEAIGIKTGTPEAELDVRGTTLVKMNSNGFVSHLTLHETADDFARLDFKNTSTTDRWTIAAKPQATAVNSRFNIFLENVGNVMTVTGDEKVGIGRTPLHPLHVGDNTSNGNGAHVTGGGTWTNGSSRTFKENFQKVNSAEILSALMGLEIQQWEYKGSDEGHHLGPIAEEFHAAFGLGSDEKYISTVDIDGVALAAIQALAKENKELRQRLDRLEKLLLQDRN